MALGRIPTYMLSDRPRLLPLGRANEPTEQLRRTLVARTRWAQDQVRQQRASGGGGGADQ
jgi:hypothetical protein